MSHMRTAVQPLTSKISTCFTFQNRGSRSVQRYDLNCAFTQFYNLLFINCCIFIYCVITSVQSLEVALRTKKTNFGSRNNVKERCIVAQIPCFYWTIHRPKLQAIIFEDLERFFVSKLISSNVSGIISSA